MKKTKEKFKVNDDVDIISGKLKGYSGRIMNTNYFSSNVRLNHNGEYYVVKNKELSK